MDTPNTTEPREPSHETNEKSLLQAVLRKAGTRIEGTVSLKLPAVPALVECYVQLVRSHWFGMARNFTQKDLDALRDALLAHAEAAFAASPFSMISLVCVADAYPKNTITWNLECRTLTLEERYEQWVRSREPPLFGQHADAKVMEIAESMGTSALCSVLDVGAGSGRNTLPLARLGLEADAVEITPALAKILRDEAAKEQLNVRVFEGDILEESLPLPRNHYHLVVLAEVLSHFRSLDEVRRLFVVADKILASGGILLFNSFVARDGYQPDQLTRQVSQLMWSCLFTRDELREASSGLAFELVSSEPTYEYEKARLPAQHWPPTAWFEAWSAGTSLFDLPMDKCPMELRWLVYRKTR